MTYLFFDTETTGLPEDETAPTTNTDNWPRIVQIAWCQASGSSNQIGDVESHIIRPDGFRIPHEAESVHGISTGQASREGSPLRDVLEAFLRDVRDCEKLVAHNAAFDKSVVGAEFVRSTGTDSLNSTPSICTMRRAEIFCGKSNYFGYRYPSLQELHNALFGHQFDNPHDAAADAEAGAKCFLALLSEGVIEDTTAQHRAASSLNIFSARNKRTADSPF